MLAAGQRQTGGGQPVRPGAHGGDPSALPLPGRAAPPRLSCGSDQLRRRGGQTQGQPLPLRLGTGQVSWHGPGSRPHKVVMRGKVVPTKHAPLGVSNERPAVPPVIFVHLSDIHFHSGDSGYTARMSAVRTELMHDLAAMHSQLGDATAVVVTGDVAYSGASEEYAVARSWLDQVSARAGSPDALVLTVPGNHDVHWPAITPSARMARESLRSCPIERLTPSIDELIGDSSRPLLAALDNYNEFALGYRCEVPKSGLPWEAALPLPAGYHLAVRGLTTVFNSDQNDDRGTLVVGKTQTSLPRDEPGAVYVLLAHHGPEDCRDTTEIRDRIRHRTSALLCGHRHDQRVQSVNGCLEIIAGAVHPEEQVGYYPTYNWIRFDVTADGAGNSQLIIEIWPRIMRPEWNRFGPGGESTEPRREVFALPPLPAACTSAGAPTGPPPSATDDGGSDPGIHLDAAGGVDCLSLDAASHELQGAAARPPLTDEEGRVDEQRRIARDLLDLTVPNQERVLLACGLLDNADLRKDHVTMILTALAKVTEPEPLARLAAAVAQAKERAQGRSA